MLTKRVYKLLSYKSFSLSSIYVLSLQTVSKSRSYSPVEEEGSDEDWSDVDSGSDVTDHEEEEEEEEEIQGEKGEKEKDNGGEEIQDKESQEKSTEEGSVASREAKTIDKRQEEAEDDDDDGDHLEIDLGRAGSSPMRRISRATPSTT